MNGLDIAIIVIVCVAFVAAAGFTIYKKIKRKGGCCDCCDCGGGCGDCGKCKAGKK